MRSGVHSLIENHTRREPFNFGWSLIEYVHYNITHCTHTDRRAHTKLRELITKTGPDRGTHADYEVQCSAVQTRLALQNYALLY